jgi:tRNA 2-selenouridine synthase
MLRYIKPSELREYSGFPIIDVRTPAEYLFGHIPGASNIPLFSEAEREKVGIRYHDSGRDSAFLLGIEIVGPKMADYIKKLNKLTSSHNPIVIYCWRGGMRSESMGWLFEKSGHDTYVIEGGYKAFRSHIRTEISEGYEFVVIGGMTGAGKTEVIKNLCNAGAQTIDLEDLANHKGSVYGHMGQDGQPTNENFENMLWGLLQQFDPKEEIYIEDESRSIGKVALPEQLYLKMSKSKLMMLDVDIDIRADRLVRGYGVFDKEMLIENTNKLEKYLGGENHKKVVEAIDSGNLKDAAMILLRYYDKKYRESLMQRSQITIIPGCCGNSRQNAMRILQHSKKNIVNNGTGLS